MTLPPATPVKPAPSGRKPRALDLFCGAGGVTKGLQRAGFYVVGVDIHPQPRYCGDEFFQADAMTFSLDGFDFYAASPPCQRYSITRHIQVAKGENHPDLVEPIRNRLRATGKPYVIENVTGAPLLRGAVMLCGTMFGLKVFRHRRFETSALLLAPPHHKHDGTTGSHRGYSTARSGRNGFICVAGWNFERKAGAAAMGIDWMKNRKELAQAIPPAYSQWIGEQMMQHVLARMERAA